MRRRKQKGALVAFADVGGIGVILCVRIYLDFLVDDFLIINGVVVFALNRWLWWIVSPLLDRCTILGQ